MKFSSFLLALVPLTLAAPFDLEERSTPATVLADLKALNADVTKLKTTLGQVGSTVTGPQLVTLQNENTAILNAINKATTDANNSPNANKAQSKTIINYVKNTLESNTFSTLDLLVSKKAAFANAGATGVVKSDLTDEKAAVAKLGTALQAKAAQPYKGQAPAIEKAFAQHFQTAINAFS